MEVGYNIDRLPIQEDSNACYVSNDHMRNIYIETPFYLKGASEYAALPFDVGVWKIK